MLAQCWLGWSSRGDLARNWLVAMTIKLNWCSCILRKQLSYSLKVYKRLGISPVFLLSSYSPCMAFYFNQGSSKEVIKSGNRKQHIPFSLLCKITSTTNQQTFSVSQLLISKRGQRKRKFYNQLQRHPHTKNRGKIILQK